MMKNTTTTMQTPPSDRREVKTRLLATLLLALAGCIPHSLGKIKNPTSQIRAKARPLPPLRQHLLLVTLRFIDPLGLIGDVGTAATLLPHLPKRHHLQSFHESKPLCPLALLLQPSQFIMRREHSRENRLSRRTDPDHIGRDPIDTRIKIIQRHLHPIPRPTRPHLMKYRTGRIIK